jgi:hypothetical protein
MIGSIKSNDAQNTLNLLAGKFGWSDKDPHKRFYLQNVIIGTVAEGEDENGEPCNYLVPWAPESKEEMENG